MTYHYVWLLWSAAFLVPWLILYAAAGKFRPDMLRVSALTSLLGLTEPIFVPGYWNPPSLFELAQRTGFDIESLVFSFAIGGIGAAAYNVLARRDLHPMPHPQRHAARHRLHRLALLRLEARRRLRCARGFQPELDPAQSPRGRALYARRIVWS